MFFSFKRICYITFFLLQITDGHHFRCCLSHKHLQKKWKQMPNKWNYSIYPSGRLTNAMANISINALTMKRNIFSSAQCLFNMVIAHSYYLIVFRDLYYFRLGAIQIIRYILGVVRQSVSWFFHAFKSLIIWI